MARRLGRIRHPGMGLELNRRLADAGLVERQIVPVLDYAASLDNLRAYGWDLTEAAEVIVAEGHLPSERVAATLRGLSEASQAETLYAYVGMFIAAGRVPVG